MLYKGQVFDLAHRSVSVSALVLDSSLPPQDLPHVSIVSEPLCLFHEALRPLTVAVPPSNETECNRNNGSQESTHSNLLSAIQLSIPLK